MPNYPTTTVTGSELIYAVIDGTSILLTRPQVVALLALTEIPSAQAFNKATAPSSEARVKALQGRVSVVFTRAQFLSYLAAAGAPDVVPVSRSVEAITGRERIVGLQGNNLVGLDLSEAIDFRDNTDSPPTDNTLGTLTLSDALQIGTATSGTIIGATLGSAIVSNIPGITVNSGARTYSGTPTGPAQTIANGLVETLAGATGSPKANSVTVAAAGATGARTNIGVLGASRQRQNIAALVPGSGTAFQRTITQACGHMVWAEFFDPRIDFTVFTDAAMYQNKGGFAFANDGETMTQMLARVPTILASDVQWVLFDPSVGNIGNDSDATYIAKAQDIMNRLIAGGKKPIYMELVDRGVESGGFWIDGGAGHTQALSVSTQLKTWCAAQSPAIPVLLTRDLVLTTNGNGTTVPKSEYVRPPADTTHFTPLWGRQIGRRLAAIVAANIPAATPFDAAAAGNLVTNAAMAGTVAVTGTNLSGTAPTSYSFARVGTGAAIMVAPETRGGVIGAKVTIDRAAMSSGVADTFTMSIPFSGAANNAYHVARAKLEAVAGDGIRAIYMTWRDNAGTENYSRALSSINAGGSPTAGTDAYFQDTDAIAGWIETMPIAFANTGAATLEVVISYDKGTTGAFSYWIAAPELRVVADPHLLGYDETNVAPAAISTSGTQTIAENTVLALQMSANQPGTWAAGGTDAALFSVDNFGVVKFIGSQNAPAGALDFEDAHAPSYSFTVTLTPFNPAIAAVTKTFTLAVTNVADGNTDQMTSQFAAATPLETNSAQWTLQSGTAGQITYTGNTNGISATATAASLLFMQDGNTVEQRIQFMIRTTSTSAGNVEVLKIDAANYIAVGGWATKTLTVRKVVAGTNTAMTFAVPADYKSFAVGDILTFNIRNMSGVYTLEAWVNSVAMTVSSGSADVTALVTGGGALAAARQSGLSTRSATVNNWLRGFHNEAVTGPFASLGYLKALTWAGGSTSFTATGATDAKDIANRTPLSGISLGTISPLPSAGSFFADGDTIRSTSVASGTYTIPVIETQTDGTVASPTTKTTSLTWIVP